MTKFLSWSSEVANRFERLANLTDEVHLAAVSSNTEKSIRRSELMEKQSASQLMADNLQQLLEILGKQLKEDFHQQIRAIEDLVGLTKRWTSARGLAHRSPLNSKGILYYSVDFKVNFIFKKILFYEQYKIL